MSPGDRHFVTGKSEYLRNQQGSLVGDGGGGEDVGLPDFAAPGASCGGRRPQTRTQPGRPDSIFKDEGFFSRRHAACSSRLRYAPDNGWIAAGFLHLSVVLAEEPPGAWGYHLRSI